MKKVIIASENPAKIKVAEKAFASVYPEETFEFIAIKSDSGVPDQPMGEETRLGANNRLKFIKGKFPDADFWISQEGGLFKDGNRLSNRAWIAVCDKEGCLTEASTSNFYLPKKVEEYVKEGLELGHANDKFFDAVNSKQGVGVIGYLTDGIYDRTEYYLQPAIIALSEIKHKDWFN
ncbi:MAG: inosine/xanthosine triphosphatase [Patescibacteria group bacterium]